MSCAYNASKKISLSHQSTGKSLCHSYSRRGFRLSRYSLFHDGRASLCCRTFNHGQQPLAPHRSAGLYLLLFRLPEVELSRQAMVYHCPR